MVWTNSWKQNLFQAFNVNARPPAQLAPEPEFTRESTLGSVTTMLASSHCFGFLIWFDFCWQQKSDRAHSFPYSGRCLLTYFRHKNTSLNGDMRTETDDLSEFS